MGFPQRLLADDERLVLVLRQHIKVLIVPFLILLAAIAVPVTFAVVEMPGGSTWWLIIGGALAAIVALIWVVWPIIVWWNSVYAITTRRLILRSGVFNRAGHDMPLSRLNDVSFEHNLIERMLGCGTLIVESAGERGQLTLNDIPKVEVVQRTLYRLSEDVRGVHTSDALDPQVARELDDAFDDEYRGPASGSAPTGP
jgi:uncharacterized membrane protein YdbT with pleckstrin-like domain